MVDIVLLISIEPMKDASDEDIEDDLMKTIKSHSGIAKSRSEREEKLRQMMDDDGKVSNLAIIVLANWTIR